MTAPEVPDAHKPGWSQSMAHGAPGLALPHIERARTGRAGWEPVHHLARQMTREPLLAHPDEATLFHGAPAVAYTLHAAAHPAYARALRTLDAHIEVLIRARLRAARARIDQSQPAYAAEFDLINGLTGLGAYLLHRNADQGLLRDVLSYLVRLTRPITVDGDVLPGWWAIGSPDRRQSPRWDGGHAGFGMAHGISGPLALLSLAARHGVTVAGCHEAIHAICAWLDQWRGDNGQQAWWPEVIDRAEFQSHTVTHPGPHRPSWCYGAPGIARAQQLAGLALNDHGLTHLAEQAMIGCLSDRRQRERLSDQGLCHGLAGLIHTAARAATDSHTTALADATTPLANALTQHQDEDQPDDGGFLEGSTGARLTADTFATGRPPASGWDTCLLVGG